MSDLESFTFMLERANVKYSIYDTRVKKPDDEVEFEIEETIKEMNTLRPSKPQIVQVIQINSGYRSHCEAYFDADGHLLDII